MKKEYDEEGNLITNTEEQEEEETTEEDEEDSEEQEETVSLSKHLSTKKKLEKKLKEAESKNSNSSNENYSEDVEELVKESRENKIKSAYNIEFDKFADLYPQLKEKRDVLYNLTGLPSNEGKSIEDIALETFSGLINKSSSENTDIKQMSEKGEKIDFRSLTPEQEDKIFSDPKLASQYHEFLDTQG